MKKLSLVVALLASTSAFAQFAPPVNAKTPNVQTGGATGSTAGTTGLKGLRPSTSPPIISLDQAFLAGIEQSFDLRIANAKIDESKAQVTKAWAMVLPNITGMGEYTYNYPEQSLSLVDPKQLQSQALVFDALSGLTAAQAAQVTDPTQKLAILERADQLESAAKKIRQTKIQSITITPAHVVDGNLTLALPLFNARALPTLQNAYGGVDITKAAVRNARAGVIYGIARTYYQVVAAKRIVDIAQKQVASATAHRDLTKQRVDEGLSTPLTLQRAELDLAKAQSQVQSAEGALKLSKGMLGSLMGRTEDFDVAEPPAIPPIEQNQSVDELYARALDARDDLKSEKMALEMADRSKTAAWMGWLPTLNLIAQGRATSNTSGLVTEPFTGAVIVQAQIPIFDGGVTLGTMDEADARLRQELLRVKQLESLVDQEVRGTVDDLALKRTAVETAQRVAELAKAQKQNVDDLFAAGAATALDVSDANLAAFSSDVDLARARFDLETARLGLAYAIGELRPNEDVSPAPLAPAEEKSARDAMAEVKSAPSEKDASTSTTPAPTTPTSTTPTSTTPTRSSAPASAPTPK